MPTTSKIAVVQDGDHVDSFVLGYGAQQKWEIWLHNQDINQSVKIGAARDSATPVTGQWTHLAGVYDAIAGEVRLYVDGELAASGSVSPLAPPWSTSRQLTIGREWWDTSAIHFWSGQIADVQVFDRVLVEHDFTGQLRTDPDSGGVDEPGILQPLEVGRWDFAQARSCRLEGLAHSCYAPDLTPFARHLALKRGAEVQNGNRDNGLHLDGYYFPEENPEPWEDTQEWGRSAVDTGLTPPDENGDEFTIWQDTPVLRTDQSFTVSAWVKMDRTDVYQMAVAQDDSFNSGFYLYYGPENGGVWKFKLFSNASAADNSGSSYAIAPAPDATDSWHHLVGVLDVGRRQMRLYVDGTPTTTDMNAAWSPWQASGPLTIGRSRVYGNNSDWFHGGIDDVGIYQGAMTDAQVKALYESQVVAGFEPMDP